jgi:hypothetical protein
MEPPHPKPRISVTVAFSISPGSIDVVIRKLLVVSIIINERLPHYRWISRLQNAANKLGPHGDRHCDALVSLTDTMRPSQYAAFP